MPKVLFLPADSVLPTSNQILHTQQTSFVDESTHSEAKIKRTPEVSKTRVSRKDLLNKPEVANQQNPYVGKRRKTTEAELSGEHNQNGTDDSDIMQQNFLPREISSTNVKLEEKQLATNLQNISYTNAYKKIKRIFPVSACRLGNHLFNLASAFGLSRTNNRRLVLIPKFVNKIQPLLNITQLHVEVDEIPQRIPLKKVNVRTGAYNIALEHLE